MATNGVVQEEENIGNTKGTYIHWSQERYRGAGNTGV